MKNLLIILCFIGILSSCANTETFEKNGKTVIVEPYGWFDESAKNDSVQYKVCIGNIVWSVVLVETVAAPIIITGVALWEPVRLKETK